jgi:hypothetical protein
MKIHTYLPVHFNRAMAIKLAAGCAALSMSASVAAITLEGFEAPILNPNEARYSNQITGSVWTFSGTTGRGLIRNGSPWNAPAAPQGRQMAFLQGGNAQATLAFNLAAGNHTVSFYAANFDARADHVNPIQVKVDGRVVGKIIPEGTAFKRYTTPQFTLSANATNVHSIELSSTNGAVGDFVTFIDAVSITPAGMQEPMVITILPNDAESTIRSDITPRTYGSGFEPNRIEIRTSVNALSAVPPESASAAQTAKEIIHSQIGSLRFPNGTPGELYISENPNKSYGANGVALITPDQIVDFTSANKLNMERLLEVNTWMWHDLNNVDHWVSNNASNPKLPPSLNVDNMNAAAQKAADWVERDAKQSAPTRFWEVGNEDWSYWSGDDYGRIFNAFQDKMLAKNSNIKLLAQGLATDYQSNSAEAWLAGLTNKLGANAKSVYAYSVHKYLNTSPYLEFKLQPDRRRKMQTEDMLALVHEGEPINRLKTILKTNPQALYTKDWKIWVTEFNIQQPSGSPDKPIDTLQDMGHALVIADWTGKMLEQNIERMFMLSLDHSPQFGLLFYDGHNNPGASLEAPRFSVPGYAFSRYAQEFGSIMVRNTIVNNPTLTATNQKSYPQLSVYSSLMLDKKSLRIMVINRHMTAPAVVSLNTLNVAPRLLNASYGIRRLQANNITDSNLQAKDVVKWSDWTWAPQGKVTGIDNVQLAPASVNLFIIPVETPYN